MAKRAKPKQPDVPWADAGNEIVEPGIGLGFVQWENPGESIRGKLLPRWRSKSMRSAAVAIELTEVPNVPVYHTEDGSKPERLDVGLGDKVNFSLSYDLSRKLTPNLEGREIGVYYQGDQVTPKGNMRVFKVFTFEDDQLPF